VCESGGGEDLPPPPDQRVSNLGDSGAGAAAQVGVGGD
jgi:hypothetical protein